MRSFGLADGLGIVGALVAVMYLPGQVDPLTYPKLLVLAGGALFLAPFVVQRWRARGRPSLGVFVIAGAVVGIIGWGLVSMVATGAPWAVSIFGWWGRGDGWLAWLSAAILLLGASTLSIREAQRTVTWLLGGGAVVALLGIFQVLGLNWPPSDFPNQATGLMGNINFSSAYFAMIAILALGRVLTHAVLWQRVASGVLFVVAAMLAVLNESQQGEAALAAGVVAVGVAAAILNRGPRRMQGLIAAGTVVAVGAALLVASFFAVGPLARLWSERTFDIRQEYWASAINIMNGLPIFGTGPDGFARYVAEYRPESYVELLGPVLRVSAAHNIALQFGATIGWLGLILWVVAFAGALIFLLARIVRGPVACVGFTTAAFGALVVYVVQGMVSIDMLPILTTGWLIAGLAIAAAREPMPVSEPEVVETPKSRRQKVEEAARARQKSQQHPVPVVAIGVGSVLGLIAVVLVGVQMAAANAVQNVSSQEQALSVINNPLTPCPLRVNITQQVLQQLPAEVAVPATYAATAIDPRCAPMINFQSDVAVQQEDLEVAGPSTLDGITFDPLLDYAWLLRARFLLQEGDIAGAEIAAVEAVRVQALYPEDQDASALEDLLRDIEQARSQTTG